MRTEEEINDFYKRYVVSWGRATVSRETDKANQFLGAAFACGRIMGRSIKRIDSDLKRAKRLAEKT